MISSCFSHAKSSTLYKTPQNIIWEYNKNNEMSVYVDIDVKKGIEDKNDGKIKILWLLESPSFNNNVFTYVKNNIDIIMDVYEQIWTYNDELLRLDDKFKWVFAMGSWVTTPMVHEKTKLLSMITSNKNITQQQKFRINFINENKNKFDLFGVGYNPIKNKEDGLCEYMFSICVENDTYDTYFTEKILDCFATGTIPIYKGTTKILNHFDGDGIIFLDDLDFSTLNCELYWSKIDSIKKNLENVKKFLLPEDYVYDNYLKKLIK